MTEPWRPSVAYSPGSVVEYQGTLYRIIQPHTSQVDWTPPVTPALWGAVPPTSGHAAATPAYIRTAGYPPPPPAEHHIPGTPALSQQQSQLQPFPAPPSGSNNALEDYNPRSHLQSYPRSPESSPLASHPIQHPSTRQHLGSVAALKSHHAGSGNWLEDAKDRTEDFYKNGPRAPTTWVFTEGGNVPQGAYNGGERGENPMYIRRAHYEGHIRIGSAFPGAHEILLGDPRAVQWIHASGTLHLQANPGSPIEGGVERDGTLLGVARTRRGRLFAFGTCSPPAPGALVDGDVVQDYEVLCYL